MKCLRNGLHVMLPLMTGRLVAELVVGRFATWRLLLTEPGKPPFQHADG